MVAAGMTTAAIEEERRHSLHVLRTTGSKYV